MIDRQSPPDIFDQRLRTVRRIRAMRRSGRSFLLERCASDAAERLIDINRRFDRMLIIGMPSFAAKLQASLPLEKRPLSVINLPDFLPPSRAGDVDFDAVITAPLLHHVNDIPAALGGVLSALKPDGLFITALYGEQTLASLRQALYKADDALRGAPTPRVSPMISYSQLAGLLGQAGFAMPVIDRDRVDINYQNLATLFNDLRDVGETNILTKRDRRFLGKDFMSVLEDSFEQNDSGGYPVKFDILWATGWRPDAAQPKPLKPGSAKTSLAQSLRQVRGRRLGSAPEK